MRTAVVEPVLGRLKSRLEHKKIPLQWDWKEESVLIADTDLMDICFSNLIVNALKYGMDWIRLSADRQDGFWVFGVSNGGIPIPREKIPLLFKKFSRLVKSDDGVGLGLNLIRKIVERHNGEVWCESDEEKGTSFYMKIPIT